MPVLSAYLHGTATPRPSSEDESDELSNADADIPVSQWKSSRIVHTVVGSSEGSSGPQITGNPSQGSQDVD